MLPLDEAMWNAVVGCDKNWDGRFFYAVATVGVYCRPSCKSRTPLRKNVRYFPNREAAQTAGFRPCKRCRPDLSDYSPEQECARRIKELLEKHYLERQQLATAMRRFGLTPNRSAAVFKRQYGMAPLEYLNRLRAERAKRLLAETDMPLVDLAVEVGFAGLSAFYHFFKKQTGTTPKQYRVAVRERACSVLQRFSGNPAENERNAPCSR
jgi:AraC family transcriptional regulator of adaptative response / methylphosphotriester-DNA alkyltransferase methyltransferase